MNKDPEFPLYEFGQIIHKNIPYGNCLKKTFNKLLVKEMDQPLPAFEFKFYPANPKLFSEKVFDCNYTFTIHEKNNELYLFQYVPHIIGQDAFEDEKQPYPRISRTIFWYPLLVAYILVVKVKCNDPFYWGIFNGDDGLTYYKIHVENNVIFINGKKTTINLEEAYNGLEQVSAVLTGKEINPLRDFELLYSYSTFNRLMGNTVLSKKGTLTYYHTLPDDFYLPYLKPTIAKCVLSKDFSRLDPKDLGDHNCRCCPYQKSCYTSNELFPTSKKDSSFGIVKKSIIRQRRDDLRD